MKSKKILTAVLALVLVMACTVGGTLAWLTAKTDAVENTFTVGKINITLTETFNNETNDAWVGKIVPGAKQDKDPTVTVLEGSEKCWVYAMVENNMLIGDAVAVIPNVDLNDWTQVAAGGNRILYRYKDVVDAADADVPHAVFTEVEYLGSLITEQNIAELGTKTILVDAYAHQSENVSADDADKAAKSHFGFAVS